MRALAAPSSIPRRAADSVLTWSASIAAQPTLMSPSVQPILNQTKDLQATPQVRGLAFRRAWHDFVAEVRQRDPKCRFRSNFFTALGVDPPR